MKENEKLKKGGTKEMKKQNLSKGNPTSHIPPHTSSKGITLIALVITIIVMLILVAVSVSAAINGGLFGYAKNAVDETQAGVDAEQKLADGRVKVDGNWYASIEHYLAGIVLEEGVVLDQTALRLKIEEGYNAETGTPVTGQLTAELNEIEGTITWSSDNESVATVSETGLVTAITEGIAKITATCIYNGETYTATCDVTVEIPVELKVGDYVNYTPDTGTYKVADGEYGSGRDATTEGYQSFTTETGDSKLKWRILSINETTGEIEIVAATAGQTLTLKGADGYNHSVDILNDLCETLYSKTVNGVKVAIARSINVEDINAKTTYDYTTYEGTYANYNDELPFSDYGTSYRKYPNLYAKEDGFYIAGEKQPNGISGSIGLEDGEINGEGVTEYKTVTGYTDDNVAETKKDVSVTYSYYYYAPESYLNTNLGINTAPKGLINLGTTYWLASRCVNAYSSSASFDVRCVHSSGNVYNYSLFSSDGNTYTPGCAVRPVVSLGSEIKLTKDVKNSSNTVTYWNVEF